jgi:hypothetical protein
MSMRKILFTLSLSLVAYAAAVPAAVEDSRGSVRTFGDAVPHGKSTTCWYDENGIFTGYAPAPEGAKPGTKTQAAASGTHAWSFTVAGDDPAACPAKLPVSTFTEQ